MLALGIELADGTVRYVPTCVLKPACGKAWTWQQFQLREPRGSLRVLQSCRAGKNLQVCATQLPRTLQLLAVQQQ